MSAADFAHWDRERQQYGYYLENGRWIPTESTIETSAP